MLCYAMLCYVMLCYIVLSCVVLCSALLYSAVLYYIALGRLPDYVLLSCVMLGCIAASFHLLATLRRLLDKRDACQTSPIRTATPSIEIKANRIALWVSDELSNKPEERCSASLCAGCWKKI